MRNVTRIALPLLIASVLAITATWAQEDMTVVDKSVFDNPQRTPSVFVHDEHNEAAGIDDCATCHHVYEDGKLVEDESSEDSSCSDCHSLEGGDGQPSLMNAFHANCKGCHQAEGKGPVLCGECHKKK
ncbi:acidic tetraheme cytochrome c3 TmcA [uncultured Desulfosarcina sp.]|uniref:acidic tetraheme cytochrome c3 TmcA n=1 Tax=uncultured Desulfosarcina sp. TaxID=218289 RepID=UPI0029C6B681|nr:cytochrome c3 family protein [uncultured Desulfosarcina sp.]